MSRSVPTSYSRSLAGCTAPKEVFTRRIMLLVKNPDFLK
jgi:hypothetical protein